MKTKFTFSFARLRQSLLRDVTAALIVGALFAQSVFAVDPQWWSARGVLQPGAAPDDFAVLNQGQLKHFATQAIAELNAELPGGAGFELNELVRRWSLPSSEEDNFSAATVGQLKHLGALIGSRIEVEGGAANLPWTTYLDDDDDNVTANIGQAKAVFSFQTKDLDVDRDGIPTSLELLNGTNPRIGNFPLVIPDMQAFSRASVTNESAEAAPSDDGSGDQDRDGKQDFEDAVIYDNKFDHPPVPAPSYAVVELGDSTSVPEIIDVTDGGKVLWRKTNEVSGRADYTCIDINNPSGRTDFTFDRSSSHPVNNSLGWVEIKALGEDGKMFGYSRDIPVQSRSSYRGLMVDPSSPAQAVLLPVFTPPNNGVSPIYTNHTFQQAVGPGDKLFGSIDYWTYPAAPQAPQTWQSFYEWDNSEFIFTEAIQDTGGYIYSRELGNNPSSFGIILTNRKMKTGTATLVESYLQTQNSKKKLYDSYATPGVSYTFNSVAPFEMPWVMATKPVGIYNQSSIFKPNQSGDYEDVPIFANEAAYPDTPLLSAASFCTPEKQIYIESGYIWANGAVTRLNDLANVLNSGYSVGSPKGMTKDGSFVLAATKSGTRYICMLMPVDFGIATEDIIVPADVSEVVLPVYFEGIDPHILGARVRFTVVEGSGSMQTSTVEFDLDEPDQEAVLLPGTTVHSTRRVQAEITQLKIGDPSNPASGIWMTASLKAKSGTITVGPGDAANIQFFGSNSLPSDGTTQTTISALVTDTFGNRVATGTPVFWRLKGDGKLEQESLETDISGIVTARLTAGRIPSLNQTVILEADTIRQEYPIANASLNVSLVAGTVQTTQYGSSQVKTFTVTASSNAADGTPVGWRTSQGSISPASSTISGGTAAATVSVHLPNEAGGAPVVVTVGVAESSAITSVEVTDPLTVTLNSDPVLVRGRAASATISAPSMVGQQVLVEAHLVREDKSVIQQPQPQGADAYVNVPGMLTLSYRDYASEVVWQRPLGPVQSSMVLLEHGSYVLSVGEDGLPQLSVNGIGGSSVLSITDPLCAPAPGSSATIRVSHLRGGSLTLSCGGRTESGFYSGPIAARTRTFDGGGSTGLGGGGGGIGLGGGRISLGGLGLSGGNILLSGLQSLAITPAAIPAASCPHILSVSVSGFYKTLETPVLGLYGEPPPPPISPGVYPPLSTVMPAGGSIQVALTAPLDLTKTAVIVRTTVGSLFNEVQWSVVSNNVFPRTTPAPDAPADAGGVAEASAAMYENVQYDNRAATSLEVQELRRYAGRNAALAAASGYTAHLEELAPPASGGDLAHQAQQGRSFLEMAAQINNAISEINEAAQRMDQLTITGEEKGKHLFQMNTAGLLRKAIGQGSGSVEQWLSDGWDKLGDRLTSMGDAALTATVNSFQSTMSWTHTQLVAAKLDNVPLLADADKLAQQLTEEGLVDYVKALARLTATIAKNPQAAAMHLITQLESLVKPKLNEWAAAGGEDEKVAAAGAGMLAFGVQTGAMMASSACDTAAVRRMVAQALGTVISAALGSQEAKDELEEMIPFWSWLVMGEQVADLWEAADYYGSGKRTGELVVQIIGDITILVPVVKGAQVAIKAVSGVTRASLKQALTKAGNVFTRKKQKDVDGATETITDCLDNPGGDGGCFPAGTKVLLADGSWRPIEQIRAGDLVMTDDPRDSKAPSSYTVTDVLPSRTEQLCDISLTSSSAAGADISATTEHPFWVQNHGWKAAADLMPGMRLTCADGSTAEVRQVGLRAHECDTWNLTVAESHTFFVKAGNYAVLVHNTKPGARVYVCYQVELPNGKFYVGRCSMPWDGVSDLKKATQDAIERRFQRHHRAGFHKGFSVNKATSFWSEIYDAGDYNEKKKIYGTMRGKEHQREAYWAARGKSVNRSLTGWKAPIGENNPKIGEYLDLAETRGKLKCKGR